MPIIQNTTTLLNGKRRAHRGSDLEATLTIAILGLLLSIAILMPQVRNQTADEAFWAGAIIGP